jgi:hypothetical protein
MVKCDGIERKILACGEPRTLAQADLFENCESAEFGGGTRRAELYGCEWTFDQGEAKYRSP